MNIKWIGASPYNWSAGRDDSRVQKIVVHWIVGTLEAADATFQDGRRKASAHYGIGDTEVHQYVKEADTAWHAGNWDTNISSIGIEHEGGPDLPISDDTYQTSAALIAQLCKKYNIPLDNKHILPHNEFSNTQCPGDLDIEKLIRYAKEGAVDWEELAIKYKGERDSRDRKLEKEREGHAETKKTKDKQIQQLLDGNKIQKDAALTHTSDMNLLRTEKLIEKTDKEREVSKRVLAQAKAERLQDNLSTITTKYNKLKERKEEKKIMNENNQKIWYASKTLWVNLLAVIAGIYQGVTGNILLSPDMQITILSLVNLMLRVITREEIIWK